MTTESRSAGFQSEIDVLHRLIAWLGLAVALTGMIALVVAVYTAMSARAKHLTSGTNFSLVDAEGLERVALALSSANSPFLAMFDAEGIERVRLALTDDDQPALHLTDDQGQEIVSLWIYQNMAYLVLNDGARRGSIIMGHRKDGRPALSITDAGSTETAVLEMRSDGAPTLSLADA